MKTKNFKFLNKAPMILGFDLFDCAQAVVASLIFYAFTANYFFTLIVGFGIVLLKSSYRKIYPRNTIYFVKNKKNSIGLKHLLKKIKKEVV